MDYEKLAQQYGGTVVGGPAPAQGIDYEAAARQFGGVSASAVEPAKPVDNRPPVMKAMQDLVLGGLRGAGSIGATLLTPIDAAARAAGIQNDFIGRTDRRESMTDATKTLGADPTSFMYGLGKLGTEVTGTAGAGGLVANTLGRVLPAAAQATPFLNAIRSAGMTAGGVTGVPGLALRTAGGAVSGGASAGLVNPEDAGWGAAIGGAIPGLSMAAAKGGELVRSGFESLPISERALQSAKNAVNNGFVIPPNLVKPNIKNQVVESISGKDATSQVFSMKNAATTEKTVRQSLGIADDVPLTQDTLKGLRDEYGKAYKAVADLPKPDRAFSGVGGRVDDINPREVVEEIKKARNEAQEFWTAYNRTADPDKAKAARAAESLAKQLDDKIDKYAISLGRDDLMPALRAARKEIAKTYTVGRALTEARGEIDPQVLAKLFDKKKPLSDGLEKIGEAASAFPSVFKAPSKIGSPAAHNLKAGAAGVTGILGTIAAGPYGMAAGAIPFLAPPAARAMMLSPSAQRAMLQNGLLSAPNNYGGLLEVMQRTAPVLAAQ
jgi:hypothetical protein